MEGQRNHNTASVKARQNPVHVRANINRPRMHGQGIAGRKHPRRAGSPRQARHPAPWPQREEAVGKGHLLEHKGQTDSTKEPQPSEDGQGVSVPEGQGPP